MSKAIVVRGGSHSKHGRRQKECLKFSDNPSYADIVVILSSWPCAHHRLNKERPKEVKSLSGTTLEPYRTCIGEHDRERIGIGENEHSECP